MALCECGCGQETNTYHGEPRRFIVGHNNKRVPPTQLPNPVLCECGCGEYANPGKRFITGHNQRGKTIYHPPRNSPVCRLCGEPLTDDNWYVSLRGCANYICKSCSDARDRLWKKTNPDKTKAIVTKSNRKHGARPFDENKGCSSYLGVHIAERVLRHVFTNVETMPMNNVGYDLICNQGKKIDVKCSCKVKTGAWSFHIRNNVVADYFVLLAFDDRDNLNPLHIWMMPGNVLNHLVGATISETTIHKWDDYRLDIDKVVACCDTMRK